MSSHFESIIGKHFIIISDEQYQFKQSPVFFREYSEKWRAADNLRGLQGTS